MTFETVKRNKDAPAAPPESEAPTLRAVAPSRPRIEALSPEPQARPPADDTPAEADARRNGLIRRHPVTLSLGLVLLVLVAGLGYLYLDHASHFESTDDAFIAARQFSIAPKVAGYITAVPVTDNQHVDAGGVIARIDQRDFQVALQQAQAQVGAAAANIQNIDAQIDVQQSQIASAEAQVDQAKAALVFAQQQAKRFQDLANTGYGTVQNEQQFNSQLRQSQSALASTQSNLAVAQRQIESLRAQRKSAEAAQAQAEAQKSQAELNLSYTTVTADQPGRVVQLSAAVGEFAQAGTALTMFVPDDIWVAANFKETQLDAMRPGQPATIAIDAYPDRPISGKVASVQPGSGTAFSLLPAENATGNFVKIVQRVPVKIVMRDAPADVSLGPGMSVVPTVRIDPSPSLYERLTAFL